MCPSATQSYVIKLSCSRKVLAASGDWTRHLWVTTTVRVNHVSHCASKTLSHCASKTHKDFLCTFFLQHYNICNIYKLYNYKKRHYYIDTSDINWINNYGPIALVTACSKIFELCILSVIETPSFQNRINVTAIRAVNGSEKFSECSKIFQCLSPCDIYTIYTIFIIL